MKPVQADLFGTPPRAPPDAEYVAWVRARMHALLAKVKAAPEMPWSNYLHATIAENQFRSDMQFLPPDESAALWAELDPELDRLWDKMNEGKEMPPWPPTPRAV